MNVANMTSNRGNTIANQFVITDDNGDEFFQSYSSTIVKRSQDKVYLDAHFWDYSVTTSKYRNQFLGEKTAETKRKIANGEYILMDLNS